MDNDRLIELHSKYSSVEGVLHEYNEEYHNYRLELINNPESRFLIYRLEMEQSGFQLSECCTSLDYMIFKGLKKSKAVILKWSDDIYGISVFGKMDVMHEIKFCPWCGSQLPKKH